ncbi:MAG TPA: tetratricopeptide repeat protein, partial [Stellaceae bacterium]|nr:tetratricopeptide repeat protein [Stellaceae bacterium]
MPPQSPDIAITLQKAQAFHQRRQLAQAEFLYRTILSRVPDHFDALHLLGVIEIQRQHYDAAIRLIAQALKANPKSAPAQTSLGIALNGLKRHQEALASCDRALAINPDFAVAHNIRGNALNDLKRHEEALASYDRVLAINPGSAEALSDRSNALNDLRRHEEALASCNRALGIRPSFAEALNNRGNALNGLKRHEEALASYDRTLALRPGSVDALNNRGATLMWLQRYEEAAKDFHRLLGMDPDRDYARGRLLASRMHCCDWHSFDRDVARVTADVRSGRRTILPFEFLAVSPSPADQLQCAQIWVQDNCPASASPVWRGERYGHDRIRIAYVSADFRDHAMANLTAGLFELHDRKRFESIAVSYGPARPGDMRTRLEAAFDRFIDVRQQSDRTVAGLLREMAIDIAVDLNGFTTYARTGIFALRPAPIQVNFLGYPGTMGADYIDYILADRWVIPEEDQRHYAEKVVYLPDSYQVNDRKRRIGEPTPSRAALGLPATGFVFCSFNSNYK